MNELPWYIDPQRVTELQLHPDDQRIIDNCTRGTGQLLDDPERNRRWVIERFRENSWPMVEAINKLKPNLVVDLACGMNPYKGSIDNLVATDITPHPDVDWICDFKATPFRDSVADVVLLMNGFAFYRRNRPVFREIQRIARPGARVYCRTANRAFVRQGINNGLGYIKGITDQFGFTYIDRPKLATFTDPNDTGTYFPKDTAQPTWTRLRARWVWTWRVNK